MQPAASQYDHKTRIIDPKHGRGWFHVYQVEIFAAVPGLFKRLFCGFVYWFQCAFFSGFFTGFLRWFFGWLDLKMHVSKCYPSSKFQLFLVKFGRKKIPGRSF